MNSGLQVYNEQNKLAQWAQVVVQCRDSGLGVRQWCQERGLNVLFYTGLSQYVAVCQSSQNYILASSNSKLPGVNDLSLHCVKE